MFNSSSSRPGKHLLVTTRTTTLTSVQHAKFTLRFSDLSETEGACKEDEEQRAGRTVDWISARVARKSARWVDEVERVENELGKSSADVPTPWWDEVKRCAEGNHIPMKSESWNHPTSSSSILLMALRKHFY